MKRIINVTLAGVAATALALSLGASAPAFAQMKQKEKSVTVGGAPMYPSKNIVQN
ncbi:MAG: fasciclin domain-containing protein, partial [Pseudolabrys sp.]